MATKRDKNIQEIIIIFWPLYFLLVALSVCVCVRARARVCLLRIYPHAARTLAKNMCAFSYQRARQSADL